VAAGIEAVAQRDREELPVALGDRFDIDGGERRIEGARPLAVERLEAAAGERGGEEGEERPPEQGCAGSPANARSSPLP
jgi:hypothetical protein